MTRTTEQKRALNKALLLSLQREVLRWADVETIAISADDVPPISEVAQQLRELRDTDPDTFYAPRDPGVESIAITPSMRAAIIRILKSDVVDREDVAAQGLGRFSTPFDDVRLDTLADCLERCEDLLND